ncbi:DNA mismatch repair protein MutS [Anaerofustis stercorihominis]|uniref:DNA mismatch repair protein MutS n=3 Tax=Anaerofustis stercorihominis TaxID=214853 RepID=B1C6T4_9FIRM|nr:DNA mismatch repair protein MutS [Anaerofustis stercorihominis]EDS72721.1 DNA mismatch repair protein MutS [Anaerofustis stercorihominis DSM 17244]MCQ4794095.1 DNA mismatch repair protein MutS [Anaerofustis stercorihominis]RGD74604.1 DNA mismatch repair protein MutS [Anaerofustis stercorihominis]
MASLTPMMKQYLQTHEEVPDTILFYRLGDFYEMFFDDAKTASKELDLVLTGRDCGLEEKAPMCGVPYHSADTYIAKLVEKGYKVAICEQVEDPKTAKGLVKREVQRVISPGTITEGKMLKEGENNYIMCIYYNKLEFGVTYCDITTGEFNVLSLSGENRGNELLSLLSRINPAQIIVNTILFEDLDLKKNISNVTKVMLEPHPLNYFFHDKAKEYILNQFNVYSLSSIGLDNNEIIVRSAGALLKYLDETQKRALIHINEIKINEDKDYMHLDYNTKRNLEIVENLRTNNKKDTLLDVLDNTVTSMGARELKKWVLEPLTNKDKIILRQDAIKLFIDDVMILEDITSNLKYVKDMERIISRLSLDIANGRDLLALKESIGVIPRIRILLSKLMKSSPLLSEIYTKLDELSDIYDLIESSIDDDCQVSLKNGGIVKLGYNEEIDELKNLKNNSAQILANIEKDEKEKTGIKNLKIKYNKVFGYFLEVTSSYASLVPDYFIRKQTLANSERYFTEELKDIEVKLLSVEEKLKEKEYKIYLDVKNRILENIKRIQVTAKMIAVIDAVISLAIVAKKNHYVKPTITENGSIIIKEGRHPVVEKITGLDNFIHNDTLLDNEDNRILIITGANMAGKSTYIRQVALISIMAQIGSFVPATSASISIVDRVFTRVGASDDLASGQSTFMVEMSEVSNILKYATKNSLVILDEVGRGTSTFDGLSIAHAVIEYLLDKSKIGAKTLFATHYHELTELEGEQNGVKNYSIRLESNGDEIVFLRKIERGGIDKSYGIEVGKLAGLPDEVIKRSMQILDVLEENEETYKSKIDAMNAHIRMNSNSFTQLSIGQNPDDEKLKEKYTLNKKAVNKIKTLPIESMSPIEVMNFVYELKQSLEKEDI